MKGKVLVTGSQGFISSHLCELLLSKDYQVLGIDIMNKYGPVVRGHDSHPNFKLLKLDLTKDLEQIKKAAFEFNPDFIIHAASRVGGISYFHSMASDLLRDNMIMDSNIFSIAIELKKSSNLKKIVLISSSMVYESVPEDLIPTPESVLDKIPFPKSTYGFSKLALHFQAQGALDQYGLPYTLILPFNACGAGEDEAIGFDPVYSGNVKMLMSHVIPDLVFKAFKVGSQSKLPILGSGNQIRCYTHSSDIAKAIELVLWHPKSTNKIFNISNPKPFTVKELSAIIWNQVWGDAKLDFEYCEPFQYDVQNRQPDVSLAKDLLGFTADVPVEQAISEVISHMKKLYRF